jgi:hypothetical protein
MLSRVKPVRVKGLSTRKVFFVSMNSGHLEDFVGQISRTLRGSTVNDDQSIGTIVIQSNDILGMEVRKPKYCVRKEMWR